MYQNDPSSCMSLHIAISLNHRTIKKNYSTVLLHLFILYHGNSIFYKWAIIWNRVPGRKSSANQYSWEVLIIKRIDGSNLIIDIDFSNLYCKEVWIFKFPPLFKGLHIYKQVSFLDCTCDEIYRWTRTWIEKRCFSTSKYRSVEINPSLLFGS